MNQPNAFLNQPSYGNHHPPATPSTQTEEVRVGCESGPEALLSISSDSRLTLTKALVQQLNLGGKSLFRLVPPRKGGQPWHFDTKPRHVSEALVLPERPPLRIRTSPLPAWLFMRPDPVLRNTGGDKGLSTISNQNVVVPLLRFRLGREVAEGYYELERV